MVRVLHVSQPVDAGVGAYVAAAAIDQVARGWDVAVACPPNGELPEALKAAGVRVLPWAAQRSPARGLVSETRSLAALITGFDPDLVHLHSSKAGLCGRLALRRGRPTLFEPNGWSWLAATGLVAVASRRWEVLACRWTDRLVCVSDGELEAARAAGLRAPAAVVRNGVDVAHYASGPGRDEARAQLGLAPGGPLVICVGRLARQKGQDRLLRAWPSVRAAAPGARLVLVGDGPDAAALRAAAPEGVVFLGPRSDIPVVLAAADVVTLPSRWEGLSLAFLEALAAGRSVVTTAVSGSEVLPADCGSRLDADPLDDDAVVSQLASALTDRCVDLGRAHEEGERAGAEARRSCDSAQTWEALAALTEQVHAQAGSLLDRPDPPSR